MPYNPFDNEYLTIAQAAEILGVSTKTIRNWINSKQLKVLRLGPRMIRIDPDDLQNLLKPY